MDQEFRDQDDTREPNLSYVVLVPAHAWKQFGVRRTKALAAAGRTPLFHTHRQTFAGTHFLARFWVRTAGRQDSALRCFIFTLLKLRFASHLHDSPLACLVVTASVHRFHSLKINKNELR